PSHSLGAADDVVERDEYVAAPIRAVLKDLEGGEMPVADLDASGLGRHQRQRDTDVFLLSEDMLGIVKLEGEAQHGRDGPQRNIALVPVEPDADLAIAAGVAADDALVDHRGCIGTGLGAGQAKTGNFRAGG